MKNKSGAPLTDRTSAANAAETAPAFPVGRDGSEPYFGMYTISGKVRVIVFGGLLIGMPAAIEGTDNWTRAFELARRLKVNVQALYGYSGSLTEAEK